MLYWALVFLVVALGSCSFRLWWNRAGSGGNREISLFPFRGPVRDYPGNASHAQYELNRECGHSRPHIS